MIRHLPRRDYNLESDTHIEFSPRNSLIVSFIIPSHSVLELNFSLFLSLIFRPLNSLSLSLFLACVCAYFTRCTPYRKYGYAALSFVFLGLFAHLYGSCYGIHRRDLNPTRRGRGKGREEKDAEIKFATEDVCSSRCRCIPA